MLMPVPTVNKFCDMDRGTYLVDTVDCGHVRPKRLLSLRY